MRNSNTHTRKSEVLDKIREAKIFGTDYALLLGNLAKKFPILPGHEAVEEIFALGSYVKG